MSGVARSSTTRTIDALGRINRIDTLTGAALHARRDYTYNTANQRTEVVHEDAFRWLYDYDALGQVTSAQKKTAASTLLPGYDHAYAYDTIGNRVNTTTNGRLATYAPDLRNQYASRTLPGALDVLGSAPADVNILVDGAPTTRSGELFHRAVPVTNASAPVFKSISIQATLPGPPAQTATETRSAFLAKTPEVYAHDLDGNLTQDGLWTYTWDAENRLIQLETRSDVAAQAAGLARVKLTFAYDSQGRRVRKQVFAWTGGAWAATPTTDLRFLYDGWNLLAEYNALSSNALVRTHVWGLDLSGREQGAGGVGGLLWTTSGATAHAPAYDANGNIVAWVDLATATVTGRRDYAAFGESVLTTGNAASLPFAFSTKYRDNETELYYYGHRYYNPTTGRWPSRDPIGEKGGVNLYGFIENNPISRLDYLGLEKRDCTYSFFAAHGLSDRPSLVDSFKSTNPSSCDPVGFWGCGSNQLNETANAGGYGFDLTPVPSSPFSQDDLDRFNKATGGNYSTADYSYSNQFGIFHKNIDEVKAQAEKRCGLPGSCCRTITVKVKCSDRMAQSELEYLASTALPVGKGETNWLAENMQRIRSERPELIRCGKTYKYDCEKHQWEAAK